MFSQKDSFSLINQSFLEWVPALFGPVRIKARDFNLKSLLVCKPPIFAKNGTFPSVSENLLFSSPVLQNFPLISLNLPSFSMLYVFFVSPSFDRDACVHHTMHVLDASVVLYYISIVLACIYPFLYRFSQHEPFRSAPGHSIDNVSEFTRQSATCSNWE